MSAETLENKREMSYIQEKFDQVLGRHMERLIGTRYGIEALPINSVNVSCLMMLMERENEIENFPSNADERYTLETLCQELQEMGFDSDSNQNIAIQEMIEKGYIQLEEERLIPQKPAVSMTQLVDKTFPKMPGLNLVAYFIQTMDEVKSERKDLENAVAQFDKMMQMQGVVLRKKDAGKQKISSLPTQPQAIMSKTEADLPSEQQVASETESVNRNILGRQKQAGGLQTFNDVASEPKILSSDAFKSLGEIRKVDFGRTAPEYNVSQEVVPDEEEEVESQAAEIPAEESEKEIQFEKEDNKENPIDLDGSLQPVSDSLLEPTFGEKVEVQPVEEISNLEEDSTGEDTEETVYTGIENEILEKTDEDIEKFVEAFEEDLAMECPMCRRSKVEAKTTARGKTYYKCSGQNCNFISWGKPYHIPCSRCNNPFLVESFDKAGNVIFKCPRATCRYWQKPPWDTTNNPQQSISAVVEETSNTASDIRKPRRRVVKRRRVRRKK